MIAQARVRRKKGESIWAKVEKSSSCWFWTGSISKGGYGKTGLNRKSMLAHRAIFELVRGPIPAGLTLDHLCRNRACVNPDHLEPVTMRENVRRSENWNKNKTTCIKGHPLSGENLIINKSGKRQCHACKLVHWRNWKDGNTKKRRRS